MKDHHRRRKRSCSPDDSNVAYADGRHKIFIRERKSLSPASGERDRQVVRKEKLHHCHKRHSVHKEKDHPEEEDRSRSSGHHRHDSGIDRERKRERSHNKEKHRNPEYSLSRVKQEPVDSDDQVQPSSSKWDSDDHNNKNTAPKDKNRRQRMDGDGREASRHRQPFGGDSHKQGSYKKPYFKREEEDTSGMEWGKKQENGERKNAPTGEKEKPNFGLSGKLTEDANTFKGVVIKYSEPPEARIPKRRWRLYPFKGEEALKVLHIHRASAFLLGRDRKVVDIPLDHPSCSKQHAALQYRLVQYTRDNGSVGKRIRPYVIDLESSNGTFVNNNKIEPKRYVELLERDVLKFGFSSREYVLLHENSQDAEEDDNV